MSAVFSALAQAEAKASNREAAMTLLANEFVNALRTPDLANAQISTPAFHIPRMTVVDVMSDLFAGKTGDVALAELLGIVAAASRGEQVAHRAMLWIAGRAAEHADFHADDLVQGWEA